ncbi:MAG: 1,4-beta-xylanase [Alphaproteobacteria bacterium]|nr:MAG: 1,4-beta-xylanase [Alphaproteobacteria bacterium]
MMSLSRRHVLMGSAALAAAALLPSGCGQPPGHLKDLAKRKGILFGGAIGPEELADTAAHELVSRECGVITPRNALKWRTLRWDRSDWNFTEGDAIARYAAANNQKMRGHVLVWNPVENMPDWASDIPSGSAGRSQAIQLMETHIEQVCAHYGDRITSWDVVNEAFEPYSGDLAPGFFMDRIGPDYIEHAFRKAREAAPHAQLVYNDYMRWSDKYPNHHKGVLKLLENLRKKEVPIDALGIQGHIGKYYGTENDRHWRQFLDEVTAMGYDLLITEFDVRDFAPTADISARDANVAALTKGFLDITLSYPELKQFICWGLSDRWSWFRQSEPREDGQLQRTAPYDVDLKPKPMYAAIAAALITAPTREPSTT